MRLPGVVEPGSDLGPEGDRSAYAHCAPDQAVPAGLAGVASDRHEVLDFANALVGEEPGDQHVGVGEVELLGLRGRVGGQFERPAPVRIEDRGEHAGGVEARAAVPVDGAVRANQGDAMQVANQSVVGDRQVASARLLPAAHACVLPVLVGSLTSALLSRRPPIAPGYRPAGTSRAKVAGPPVSANLRPLVSGGDQVPYGSVLSRNSTLVRCSTPTSPSTACSSKTTASERESLPRYWLSTRSGRSSAISCR